MKATDRHKLIDRIKTLEGLTDDERSALLGLLREHKTYGLVWEDKPEDVEERLRDELPVLVEVKERAILAPPHNSLTDNELPNHIIIEGDNLEALTTLAYTHAGKIDVIYIDPPYNTGNKDFVYNDSFVDTEDSYRHSKWLSFMSRRLKIAKKLLSDRGVIFISIDDNELAQLKMLCDEIFLPKNFVTNFIWEKKKKPSFLHRNVGKLVDYIVCYTKSTDDSLPFAIETTTEGKKYPINNAGNTLGILEFSAGYVQFNCPDQIFLPQDMSGGNIITRLLDKLEVRNGRNVNSFRLQGEWRYSQAKLNEIIEAKEPILISKTPFRPNHIKTGGEIKKMKNMLTPVHYAMETNEDGTAQVAEILGDNVFTNPKPIKLISRLVLASTYCIKNAVILDFFAGSGTTLHAVMQLNAEDGGHRQCILCTNNENGICENVTYERNKRVIEGYTKPNGEHVEGLHNNNLRYYRTDFVSRSRSTKNMRRLMSLATDMLCIKENLYDEQKTFAGLPTYKNIYRYFEHGERKMLIVYDERYVDELVGMIASVDTATKIKVYVFSPSEDPWEASFEPVADKVELCALPQAIYNTYKRILPKRRPEPLAPAEKSDTSDKSDKSDTSDDEIGGLFTHQVDDE